jgi:hypothetical protein
MWHTLKKYNNRISKIAFGGRMKKKVLVDV